MGLAMSGIAALIIRLLLKPGIRKVSRWPLASAALRAFPFALAFAPSILMKRGFGVLIPASVYLFPELVSLPFQDSILDADDWRNLKLAAMSFLVVWGVSAFILLARQSIVAKGREQRDL